MYRLTRLNEVQHVPTEWQRDMLTANGFVLDAACGKQPKAASARKARKTTNEQR